MYFDSHTIECGVSKVALREGQEIPPHAAQIGTSAGGLTNGTISEKVLPRNNEGLVPRVLVHAPVQGRGAAG